MVALNVKRDSNDSSNYSIYSPGQLLLLGSSVLYLLSCTRSQNGSGKHTWPQSLPALRSLWQICTALA